MLTSLLQKRKKNLDQLAISTTIAHGVKLNGNIKGDHVIRVDGEIEGDIMMGEGIIVGGTSVIKGSLCSDSIKISGRLIGDLTCRELYITDTGIVEGDLVVEFLKVDTGGKYSGHLRMDRGSESKTPCIQAIEGIEEKKGN
ncbi:polymer-forming cytoskeletal protein [Epilithonimonas sp.]|uniref:bactofilin family protein n=1 Tax=Epilithonimonas sp. TaxID=2894511 RepID=UPI00289AB08D|nr:polymer-forming cytoskeletal protein [Epilithonimonas sp.]